MYTLIWVQGQINWIVFIPFIKTQTSWHRPHLCISLHRYISTKEEEKERKQGTGKHQVWPSPIFFSSFPFVFGSVVNGVDATHGKTLATHASWDESPQGMNE